jgi:hypothetical protein
MLHLRTAVKSYTRSPGVRLHQTFRHGVVRGFLNCKACPARRQLPSVQICCSTHAAGGRWFWQGVIVGMTPGGNSVIQLSCMEGYRWCLDGIGGRGLLHNERMHCTMFENSRLWLTAAQYLAWATFDPIGYSVLR